MSMKKFIVLMLILVTACAPAAQESQIVLPQFLPTATAYIDSSSYPTAEVELAAPDQSASGIDIRLDRVWVEGKDVNANVCFSLPDKSDWSIWAASLTYGETVLQEYGTTLASLEEPADGQAGVRCDTLTFVVPPDADLSTATIVIDSIAATPREGDYCALYMPKIQQALLERGVGIMLDCVNVDGVLRMQIVSKPPEMSQEQAEQIVYNDEFFTVTGPWTFPFNLSQ